MIIQHKVTNQVRNIDDDQYPSKAYSEYFVKPDNRKNYIWDETLRQIVEKPVDIEQIKQNGLAFFKQKFEDFKKQAFEFPVEKADGAIITVLTDRTNDSMLYWVLVAQKPGATTKDATVLNAQTGFMEDITVTIAKVEEVRGLLAQKYKVSEDLSKIIHNKIKTADTQLSTAFAQLTPEQLNTMSEIIMTQAESIVGMSDQNFNQFINSLISI